MARQSIGEFLSTLRRAHGYTQQQVADKLSVSNRTVSSWETGNAIPDVVLLPAIAELYNVTVDEILRGERTEKGEQMPVFSPKAQEAIYKYKHKRFVWQAYVLLGLFIAGFITLYVSLLTYSFTGFIIGVIATSLGMTIFVALCIATTLSIDDKNDVGHPIRVAISRQIAICVYFAGALSLLISLTNLCVLFFDVEFGLQLLLIYVLVTTTLFVVGRLVQIGAIRKFGNDQVRADYKSNCKLVGKLAMFGAIPLAVAIALITVFSCVTPVTKNTIYENADRQAFREYMETLVIAENSWYTNYYEMQAGEYKFNLTELSKDANKGEAIKLDDKTSVIFEFGNCTLLYGPMSRTAKRYALDDFVVYNLRFNNIEANAGHHSTIFAVDYSYALEARGEGIAFIRICSYDLLAVSYIVGTAIIFADFAVLAIIYLSKKKFHTTKL